MSNVAVRNKPRPAANGAVGYGQLMSARRTGVTAYVVADIS